MKTPLKLFVNKEPGLLSGVPGSLRRSNGVNDIPYTRRIAHNFVDMTGQRAGRLVAIEYAETKNKTAQWWCKCDCGNLTLVSRGALLSTLKGRKDGTSSCGCSRSTGIGSRPYYKRNNIDTLLAAKNKAYSVYKKAAQKRHLEFSLTKEQFHEIVQKECHYCGQEPAMEKRSDSIHSVVSVYLHNGIDRKNNSEGYTIENSLPCCSICNHAKHILSYDVFINWVHKASKHIKQQESNNV